MSGNPKDPPPTDLPDAAGSVEPVCPNCGGALGDAIGGVCRGCAAAAMLDDEFEDAGPWDSDVSPQRSIGSYQVFEEIGRGGMGVIYRARRPDLDRTVALKALDARLGADLGAWARFRMEIEAVAALDHPNIVPIYDIGEDDGAPFYTMKLLDGGTLVDWLCDLPGKDRLKSSTSFRDAAEQSAYRRRIEKTGGWAAWVMAKVARAVQHAHERGILHRDLKPSNILLDGAGEPYVADFGLVIGPHGLAHSL